MGKSFAALTIADFLGGLGENLAIIDADTSNSDFVAMFQDSFPCKMANLSREEGWMDILDFVIANPDSNFIMDTPGGVRANFQYGLAMLGSFLAEQKPQIKMELW